MTAREGSRLEIERPHQHVDRYVNRERNITDLGLCPKNADEGIK